MTTVLVKLRFKGAGYRRHHPLVYVRLSSVHRRIRACRSSSAPLQRQTDTRGSQGEISIAKVQGRRCGSYCTSAQTRSCSSSEQVLQVLDSEQVDVQQQELQPQVQVQQVQERVPERMQERVQEQEHTQAQLEALVQLQQVQVDVDVLQQEQVQVLRTAGAAAARFSGVPSAGVAGAGPCGLLDGATPTTYAGDVATGCSVDQDRTVAWWPCHAASNKEVKVREQLMSR